MAAVKLLVLGAGSRGTAYANFTLACPQRGRVIGVADPRAPYRSAMAKAHGVAAERVFTDWREALARPKFADAVVIATQDAMHVEPALAAAEKGYAILLEKPMAPNAHDCRRIVAAVKQTGVLFAVCHVLRYAPFTQKLKQLIAQGVIGEVVGIQLVENVGYWHQAHSFVRGNWRNERESSPMLLAKSCHDIDWLRYLIGRPCKKVSSFGSLKHFRASERPEGAADRCLDCAVEVRCPYSAKKIYLGGLARGKTGWPVNVLTPEPTAESVTAALREGPYGRCVYACDNDVVDNQVVNLEYEGGAVASFTMIAFGAGGRRVRIYGTRGELMGDWGSIRHFDFLTDQWTGVDFKGESDSAASGHGGGDEGVMDAFLAAVAAADPAKVLSGPDETLETHLTVFAAEQARHENRVVAP